MESGIIELSKYRYFCAKDNLEASKILIRAGKYKASVNRSYYAVFHGLRSVTALDQFDSSKHSSVIAYFNRNYVKEGFFDKSISKMLDSCYRMREKSDYQDFFIVSLEMAEEHLNKAERILDMLQPYLQEKWGNL